LKVLAKDDGSSLTQTFHIVFTVPIPTLTGPSSNPVTTTATPAITWTDTAAARYDLWVDDTTAKISQLIRKQNLTTPSFTPAVRLTSGHTYRVWVQGFTALGEASGWSQAFVFTVALPAAPAIPVWTGPLGTTTNTAPTLAWTSPAAAAGYELWVTDNTARISKFIDLTGLGATSFSAFTRSLSDGHQYTAWVRALDNLNQAGSWSAALTFTMALAVPVLTGPTSPASTTPTITWTESTAGAVRYDLWVNDATSSTAQVIRQKNLTGLSFTTGTLTRGHTYRVWVQAIDAFGQASAWQVTPLVFTVA
jgi:predicted phage tail protein